MGQLQRTNGWLPEIFSDFFDNTWMPKVNATAPAINVSESEKNYVVEVAAPGMKKDDFSIEVNENNDLVVKMEKKDEHNDEKKDSKENVRYLRREFAYSKFQQTLILPDDVDKTKIEAKVEHGVLTVTLPKVVVKEEPKTSRQIKID